MFLGEEDHPIVKVCKASPFKLEVGLSIVWIYDGSSTGVLTFSARICYIFKTLFCCTWKFNLVVGDYFMKLGLIPVTLYGLLTALKSGIKECTRSLFLFIFIDLFTFSVNFGRIFSFFVLLLFNSFLWGSLSSWPIRIDFLYSLESSTL